jgi:hypothetical protein
VDDLWDVRLGGSRSLGDGDAGGHSSFLPSWSRGRGSIMQHAAIRSLAKK